MELWQIIILAIIQGITEFLPISSSAHLLLPSQLLGWNDQGLAFDAAVHVGTLAAVAIYFRRDLVRLASAWCRDTAALRTGPESRLGWAIIVATLPAIVAGFIFLDTIENQLRSTLVIATATIGFGLVLWWSDLTGSRARSLSSLSLRDALLIGLAQALALAPGTSRSGITITAALLLGFDRHAAARFSFLLSIPIITAAGTLKTMALIAQGEAAQWHPILLGAVASFVCALLAIHLFLRFLQRTGFTPYVIYRLVLGTVLLLMLW